MMIGMGLAVEKIEKNWGSIPAFGCFQTEGDYGMGA